jgi:hypothetical protein
MGIQPQDLVGFGDQYLFPGNDRYPEQTATLSATPGPSLAMRFGAVAIADPWYPEGAPSQSAIALGEGEKATVVTTIARVRAGSDIHESMAVAASVGQLDQVVTWQPLVQDEQHFHLDVDSALGAFYEITDAAVLQPLFEDALYMKGIYDRALTEPAVAMEVDGRVVAVVFLCPDGAWRYPMWAGFDEDMSAVAVLVDLKILDGAVQRTG